MRPRRAHPARGPGACSCRAAGSAAGRRRRRRRVRRRRAAETTRVEVIHETGAPRRRRLRPAGDLRVRVAGRRHGRLRLRGRRPRRARPAGGRRERRGLRLRAQRRGRDRHQRPRRDHGRGPRPRAGGAGLRRVRRRQPGRGGGPRLRPGGRRRAAQGRPEGPHAAAAPARRVGQGRRSASPSRRSARRSTSASRSRSASSRPSTARSRASPPSRSPARSRRTRRSTRATRAGRSSTANGKVIGINQQIKSSSGGGEGVGFAVPIDVAKRSLEQLQRDRRGQVLLPRRGDRGDLPAAARALRPAGRRGRVGAGRLRRRAGRDGRAARRRRLPDRLPGAAVPRRRRRDHVASTAGRCATPTTSRCAVALLDPGSTVTVEAWRDGDKRQFEVELGERPLSGPADRRLTLTPRPDIVRRDVERRTARPRLQPRTGHLPGRRLRQARHRRPRHGADRPRLPPRRGLDRLGDDRRRRRAVRASTAARAFEIEAPHGGQLPRALRGLRPGGLRPLLQHLRQPDALVHPALPLGPEQRAGHPPARGRGLRVRLQRRQRGPRRGGARGDRGRGRAGRDGPRLPALHAARHGAAGAAGRVPAPLRPHPVDAARRLARAALADPRRDLRRPAGQRHHRLPHALLPAQLPPVRARPHRARGRHGARRRQVPRPRGVGARLPAADRLAGDAGGRGARQRAGVRGASCCGAGASSPSCAWTGPTSPRTSCAGSPASTSSSSSTPSSRSGSRSPRS